MRKLLAIDYSLCTGCHSCEVACQQEKGLDANTFGIKLTQIGPDQIEKYHWQYEFVPVPTERCDRCESRLAAGKKPLCVQSCQTACMFVGTLEELAPMLDREKIALFS